MTNTNVADKTVNGVDVERLEATIAAVKSQPSLAEFKFRLSNQWINGSQKRSQTKNFYGVGQEDSTRKVTFVLDADEPDVLLGQDKSANPAEYLLHALAACMTISMVYHAAARGFKIHKVESEFEGDIDLQGFLGLSDSIRPGFQQIRVKFRIQSDAPLAAIQELFKFSPIYDSICNPVDINVQVESLR